MRVSCLSRRPPYRVGDDGRRWNRAKRATIIIMSSPRAAMSPTLVLASVGCRPTRLYDFASGAGRDKFENKQTNKRIKININVNRPQITRRLFIAAVRVVYPRRMLFPCRRNNLRRSPLCGFYPRAGVLGF